MHIVYTRHFKLRFERRRETSPVPLTWELVESTILHPDFVMPDPSFPNRHWRVKKISGHCLRVVVEVPETGDYLIAVTLLFDRKLRRKGLCG